MRVECGWTRGVLGLLILILSPHLSLQGQITEGSEVSAFTLLHALEDRDRNFIPDHLGETLRVTGAITQPIRLARADWWYVTIQDAQAGLRLLASDPRILQGLEAGDVVEAEGVLHHRRGSEELHLTSIGATGETRPVRTREALAIDLAGEGLMHRLVRVEGVLRDFDLSAQSAVLQDRSGEIEIRFPATFIRNEEVVEALLLGGRVVFTGVLSQADREAPFDSGYRIQPRTPSDLQWIPEPPVKEVVASLMGAFLLALVLILRHGRRMAQERASQLEHLTSELTDSQKALGEREAHYRALFEDDRVGRFLVEADGTFVDWNSAFVDFLGCRPDSLHGTTCSSVMKSEEGDFFETLGRGESSTQIEVQSSWSGAPVHIGLLSCSPVDESDDSPLSGSVLDITDRRELEARLLQAQKLDTLGRLAGGLAHDLNNMLTAILGNSDLLLNAGVGPEDAAVCLDDIKKSSERASRLTKKLLTMTRQDLAEPVKVDLNELILDMAPGFQRLIGPEVEIVSTLGEPLGLVHMDPSQGEQLLLNLVLNAREAMPEGGTIHIETRDFSDSGDPAKGPTMALRVSDTGVGMDEETKSKAFDPFFSTKETGSGLGLATVLGIVDQWGGTIQCQTAPGEGARFEILFPTVPQEGEQVERMDTPQVEEHRFSVSVLVVDDEPTLRRYARKVLEAAGCVVSEAENGAVALDLLTSGQDLPDLLLTDMMMPLLGGKELAKKIGQIHPNLPVIFMSGYTDDVLPTGPLADEDVNFLKKPFRPTDLLEMVSKGLQVPLSTESVSAR